MATIEQLESLCGDDGISVEKTLAWVGEMQRDNSSAYGACKEAIDGLEQELLRAKPDDVLGMAYIAGHVQRMRSEGLRALGLPEKLALVQRDLLVLVSDAIAEAALAHGGVNNPHHVVLNAIETHLGISE